MRAVLARIEREPAALLGLVGGIIGILTLTGALTPELGGSIATLVGLAVTCLRYFVVPASEVVAQTKPDGQTVAGPAAEVLTGHAVTVDVQPVDTDLDPPH